MSLYLEHKRSFHQPSYVNMQLRDPCDIIINVVDKAVDRITQKADRVAFKYYKKLHNFHLLEIGSKT